MAIPLSMIGISKEDKDMLSNRLFPEANKILIEQLAKEYGYDIKNIEKIDYSNHPIYQMNKMIALRNQKKEYLKDKDTSEFDYPFKSFDEACKKEPGKHFILDGKKETVEELNKRIEKLKIENKKGLTLDDLSSDDEPQFNVSPIHKLKRQKRVRFFPQDDEKEDFDDCAEDLDFDKINSISG